MEKIHIFGKQSYQKHASSSVHMFLYLYKWFFCSITRIDKFLFIKYMKKINIFLQLNTWHTRNDPICEHGNYNHLILLAYCYRFAFS